MTETVNPSPGLAEALGVLATRRDSKAWEFVINAMGAECVRIAAAITGDPALADDVVQETLLQVRDDARQFRPRTANADADARGWIARVCTNTALQFLRRQARRSAIELRTHRTVMPEAGVATEEAFMEREDLQRMRQAVARLPEPQRVAIVLHHFLGRDYDAVAAELGIPVGTAKIRVHRGVERLRRIMVRQDHALAPAAIAIALSQLPQAVGDLAPSTQLLHQHLHLLHASRKATIHLVHHGVSMLTIITSTCAIGAALSAAVVASQTGHPRDAHADAAAAVPRDQGSAPSMAVPRPSADPSDPSVADGRRISVDYSNSTSIDAYFGLHFRIPGGLFFPTTTQAQTPTTIACVIKDATPEQAWAILSEATRTHPEQRGDVTWILPGLVVPITEPPIRLGPPAEAPEPSELSPGPQADPCLRKDMRWLNGNGVKRVILLRTLLPFVNASVVVAPEALLHDQDVVVNLRTGTFAELVHDLGFKGSWRGKVLHLSLIQSEPGADQPARAPHSGPGF